MKIALGADHAGFALKEALISYLAELGHEIIDKGAFSYDKDDDYPDFINHAARAVAEGDADRGIVIGKSGQGEAMSANRIKGIRAAVFYGKEKEIIRLSREHNDANVLSLAAGFLSEDEAKEAVREWLETSFSNEERHIRRINKLDA